MVSALLHLAVIFAWSALFLAFYETAWFVAGLALERNDVADVAWGFGPVLLAWWLAVYARSLWVVPMAVLVSAWGIRVSLRAARRDFAPGRGEGRRYHEWRMTWRYFRLRSFFQVYLLQALLLLLVSAPIVVFAAAPGQGDLVLSVLGAAIFSAGFAFETVADRQLDDFLAEKDNHGHVMDRGLWAWSRHPDYFGESVMWWGLGVIALGVPLGWIGLVGPVTLTALLLFAPGIPRADEQHAGEPEWEAYKARTSAFVPLPPHGE